MPVNHPFRPSGFPPVSVEVFGRTATGGSVRVELLGGVINVRLRQLSRVQHWVLPRANSVRCSISNGRLAIGTAAHSVVEFAAPQEEVEKLALMLEKATNSSVQDARAKTSLVCGRWRLSKHRLMCPTGKTLELSAIEGFKIANARDVRALWLAFATIMTAVTICLFVGIDRDSGAVSALFFGLCLSAIFVLHYALARSRAILYALMSSGEGEAGFAPTRNRALEFAVEVLESAGVASD